MTQSIPLTIADFEVQLASAISVGSTSFTLSSVTDDDGNTIPNGLYCFTIDSGSSNKEYLLGTITGTSVASVQTVNRQGGSASGAARAHRVGASVKITDFAVMQRVADILRGASSLDGSNPLIYDTAPTLADGKELATVQYVLDNVNGGTVNFSLQTVSGTAGETIAAPEIVYFKESDQRWWKAEADDSATFDQLELGVVMSGGTAGGGVTIALSGLASGFTGLTAGSKYYLSDTAGEVSTTPGSTTVFLGWAYDTSRIMFGTQDIFSPSKVQKDFLNGITGMIMLYGASSVPTGFLACDGSAVSRTTYADLFAVLSTSYGVGDGSTTFNVPDFRSSVPVGYGQRVKTFTFADGDVNTGTDEITVDSNSYLYNGAAVALTTTGTLPTGLSATTYYVIRVSATVIKLATSVANANAGTAVNITAASGGGTHTLTLTLTNRALGDNGGEETTQLSLSQLPSFSVSNGTSVQEGVGGFTAQDDGKTSIGSNEEQNNMPPYTVVQYIIKT